MTDDPHGEGAFGEAHCGSSPGAIICFSNDLSSEWFLLPVGRARERHLIKGNRPCPPS